MSNKLKKVVLLLVEGETEQILLNDSLRGEFEQYDIRFRVERGDLFGDLRNQNRAIKSIVGDVVKDFLEKYRLQEKDLLAIVQIMDTDGCFVSDEAIIIDENQKQYTTYAEDFITVNNEQQKNLIIERNELKSRNAKAMWTTSELLRNKLPYQLYFFSRALEHVLFGEANPEGQRKLSKIDQFVEELDMPLQEYLKPYLMCSEVNSSVDQYEETWNYIVQGNHSLQPATNVPLLFNFIDQAQKEM